MSEVVVKYRTGPPPRTACEACGQITTKETDHCHEHGWVRGVLCRSCNALMARIDRRFAPRVEPALLVALVAVRNRCPDCSQLDVQDLSVTGVMKRVTVDLEATHERLRRAAFEARKSMSEIIREALALWFEQHAGEEAS